jgi:hypothetical protein
LGKKNPIGRRLSESSLGDPAEYDGARGRRRFLGGRFGEWEYGMGGEEGRYKTEEEGRVKYRKQNMGRSVVEDMHCNFSVVQGTVPHAKMELCL